MFAELLWLVMLQLLGVSLPLSSGRTCGTAGPVPSPLEPRGRHCFALLCLLTAWEAAMGNLSGHAFRVRHRSVGVTLGELNLSSSPVKWGP